MTELPANNPPHESLLAPLARASSRVVTTFDRVAYVGWLSALGIAGPVLIWIWPVETVGIVVVSLLTTVLLLPGLAVFLLARAVGGLTQVPSTILSQVTAAYEPPALELTGGLRSVWNVGRYLLGIRGVLWAMKDQLASVGTVLRLASWPILVGTLAAALAIAVMIPVAGLFVLATLFTL